MEPKKLMEPELAEILLSVHIHLGIPIRVKLSEHILALELEIAQLKLDKATEQKQSIEMEKINNKGFEDLNTKLQQAKDRESRLRWPDTSGQ